jgi:hypothetical protein
LKFHDTAYSDLQPCVQTLESANDAVGCNKESSFAEEEPVISCESIAPSHAKEASENDIDSSVVNVQQLVKPPRPTLEIPHLKVPVYGFFVLPRPVSIVFVMEECCRP